MKVKIFFAIFILSFFLIIDLLCRDKTDNGSISGNIKLDDSWESYIYISVIPNFEKLNSISKNMILTKVLIDTMGNFLIDLSFLPDDNQWYLLRLHLIKNGLSPTTLIIGGMNENFIHLIVNRYSKISLHSNSESPIFEDLELEGDSDIETLKYIRYLSNYANNTSIENSLIEREFVEEAVRNKLKQIADTCKNPVLSLFSIYNFDYIADFNNNPDYYYSLISKNDSEKSEYFKVFKRQLSTEKDSKKAPYTLILLLILVSIAIVAYKKINSQRLKKLTNQEKKIYEMIRKGASNQDIANEFHIEVNTVKTHVSRIMRKLKVKNRKEIIHS